MNYKTWLNSAMDALYRANPNEDQKADALTLLQAALGKNRAHILAFKEDEIPVPILPKLTAMLSRRLKGEPIAYILGEKEFWSLPLQVSTDTLIPRPDTEILVEKAVELANARLRGGENSQCFSVLDLGTGTGAIALALASELAPIAKENDVELNIVGVDLIPKAVQLAQANAIKNGLSVHFLQSDWFENVQGEFDLIVSNPPYIDENDEHLSQGDVRFEPKSALVSGENGLADLRKIIEHSSRFLRTNGWLLLEHGWQQGEKMRECFQQFSFKHIQTLRDYGGNERVKMGQYND